MPMFSRGLGRGLGLGLSLGMGPNQRILFSVATKTHQIQIPQAIRRSPILQAVRHIQLSARKTPKSSKSRGRTIPTTAITRMSPSGLALAQELASSSKPAVLYKAPSQFWLLFSTFTASSFCITYAVFNYWHHVLYPPNGLAWWVSPSYGLICLFMATMGFRFIWTSSYVVRRILAVPKSQLPPSYLTGGPDGKAGRLSVDQTRALDALNASPIALQVELRTVLPLIPPKKIIVAPGQVELPVKMAEMPCGRLSGSKSQPGPQGFFFRYIAPFFQFQRIGYALGEIKRGLTSAGLSPIKVQGIKYKIDVTGGEMLAKGKALDGLAIQRPPNEFRSGILEALFRN